MSREANIRKDSKPIFPIDPIVKYFIGKHNEDLSLAHIAVFESASQENLVHFHGNPFAFLKTH